MGGGGIPVGRRSNAVIDAAGDILRTWLAIQALGLVGLPLALLLFRALPDRGYPFAKIFGLLLTGYLTWLLAMLGLGGFGVPLIVVSALAVAGLGWWARRRVQAAAGAPARPLAWGGILAYEALFLAAMLFVVWMRLRDPVPWGTERPMDFAFFNAIQRSVTFPPADPWLSGYSINYYYFGYLLMGVVAQLTGVAPAAAYNLALALIFALTAIGIAGVIANLMALVAERMQHAACSMQHAESGISPQPSALSPQPSGYRLSAIGIPLLGVLFVLVAGNQSGAVQVVLGDERAVALDGRQFSSAIAQALGGADAITLPYAAPAGDFGDPDGMIVGWARRDKVADFNWWWPSRSLWDTYTIRAPDEPPITQRRYNITEFPFFSFRLGDMHPHVMALPFGVLAMALALTITATPSPFGRAPLGGLWIALAGLIVGSLYVINSWDLPTYLLLIAGALTLNHLRNTPALPWRAVLRDLAVLALASWLLFIPFHLTFVSLVGGLAPLVDLPLLGRITSVIGVFPATRSGLHAFLIIFGLFALPLIMFTYLAAWSARRSSAEATPPAVLGAVARPTTFNATPLDVRLLFWLPPILLIGGVLIGFPLLALAGLGMLAAWGAIALRDRPAESFGLLVVALGCAVVFGTELIYIRDSFEGWSTRFNTVFKFYYQVWLLWGALAPFALWWALVHTRGAARIGAAGVSVLALVLLIGGLVYPALTLRELGRAPVIGLDGRTPREQTDAGRAAIAWMRAHAAPGSVVLELAELTLPDGSRRGGAYNGDGGSGVSAATGIPTVIGWVGHQRQWRGGDPELLGALEVRRSDVETIFTTLDVAEAQRLLANYGVRYIYVGGLERSAFPPESLAKFDRIATPVFTQDEVTIYEVTP
jgi:YYY domain-containing protein